MKKRTFEEIMQDPAFSRLLPILEAEHRSPLPLKVQEYFIDADFWSAPLLRQLVAWVLQLERITNDLVAGKATSSDVGVFWIRLHGLFTDFQEDSCLGPSSLFVKYNPAAARAATCIDAVRAKFTPEELLWIEHERQSFCHPHPGYNRKTLRKEQNGGLSLNNNYKNLSMDRLNEILLAVLNKHEGKSEVIVTAFAKRIETEVSALATAMKSWLN
jgi:hypothetical protein